MFSSLSDSKSITWKLKVGNPYKTSSFATFKPIKFFTEIHSAAKYNINYFFSANLKWLSYLGYNKLSYNKKNGKFRFFSRIPTYIGGIHVIIILIFQICYMKYAIKSNNTRLTVQVLTEVIIIVQSCSKVLEVLLVN